MGILSNLLAPTVAQPIEAVGNVIDKLFTSDDERLTHEELKLKLLQQPQIAQIELNKVEAQSRYAFVAGARPFILWVCGLALAFVFVLNPCIQWLTGEPGPTIPLDSLMSLTVSLLGLGSLRTVEKLTGKAK